MPRATPVNPAIVIEPDGYRTDGQRLMGRQAAGNGFMRAAIAARGDGAVIGYTPSQQSAQVVLAKMGRLSIGGAAAALGG